MPLEAPSTPAPSFELTVGTVCLDTPSLRFVPEFAVGTVCLDTPSLQLTPTIYSSSSAWTAAARSGGGRQRPVVHVLEEAREVVEEDILNEEREGARDRGAIAPGACAEPRNVLRCLIP